MPDTPYALEFKLSVTEALRSQLLHTLQGLAWVPLTEPYLSALQSRGGVYQLALLDNEGVAGAVYVGKSAKTLPQRLRQHRRKLSGRTPGLIGQTVFRCAYVDEDLDAVAPEKMLMAALGQLDLAAWNNMGFGNKDPGKRRDTSRVKLGHFDRKYPINLDLLVAVPSQKQPTLGKTLDLVKSQLPFTFRFEKAPVGVAGLPVDEMSGGAEMTVAAWMGWFAGRLPDSWLIVALPGYVIAYPDIVAEHYASRLGVWRREGERVFYHAHKPEFEAGEVEVMDEAMETEG